MGTFIVVSIVVSILLARHIARVMRRRREESFARLAVELGYTLADHEDPGFVSAYDFLQLFKGEPARRASMVLSGASGERRIRAFHLVLGEPPEAEDDEEQECIATALVVEWPGQRFPYVRIDPAPGDGTTGSLGPPEFRLRHVATSEDDDFALALIERGVAEPLDEFAPMSFEVHGFALAFRCERCLTASGVRRLHRSVRALLDAMPDDVLERTRAEDRRESQ